MNAAFGDILNDGRLAIYVTNISEEGVLLQGNNLWVPKEGASAETLRYENLAREVGVELGGWSWGAQFGDLNNNGAVDLYLTNGYLNEVVHAPYYALFVVGPAANLLEIGWTSRD